MKILVDSDAMPKPLKEVLYKVAVREEIETIFVAARKPRLTISPYLKAIGAGSAFDGADDWIVDNVEKGDLIITADILLAYRVIELGGEVLNTKGEFFTKRNIKSAVAMRLVLDELRVMGETGIGPAPFSDRQRVKFTNSLNKFVQGCK